jgi:hypothetical protein
MGQGQAPDVDTLATWRVPLAGRMSHVRSVFRLSLALVALATIVGHICALPGHLHATPVMDTHDHPQSAPDHHDAADGYGDGSCEALRPGTAASATTVLIAMPSSAAAAPTAYVVIDRVGEAPDPASSPPLYLAHRALLI